MLATPQTKTARRMRRRATRTDLSAAGYGAMRVRLRVLCLALLVAAVGATAMPANAEKVGRVLFVKRADDICQAKDNDAKRRIERGVKYLDHHRLRPAGIKFAAAYRELRLGYRRIANLHRPARDHKRIIKWLHRERVATAIGVNAAVALQRHHLDRAARLTRKSAHQERLAYMPVERFKFDHCGPL
jgi:hypothetical protein